MIRIILICSIFIISISAIPENYENQDEMNFQPSSNRYYEYNLHSTRNHTENSDSNPKPEAGGEVEVKEAKSSDKLRFGLPLIYGNTGAGVQPYPGNSGGVSYMVSPMKLDLGGVALGALIGLGAVLILPKLAQAFGGPHGGYRSIDDGVSNISEMLSRIDNTLEQQNIDSSSCMQRFVCNYVHESSRNVENGEAGTVDQIIHSISNNSLITQLLDGSSIKQAVDMGMNGDVEKCSNLYKKCPIDRNNVIKVITSMLPN